MREIEEVVKKVNQGFSNPYQCIVEGESFIIKGLPRINQVNEWVCANLAVKFGLPIAEFEILDLSEEIFDNLDDDAKFNLGCGPVFGSKVVESALWFEPHSMQNVVSFSDKMNIFLFDYWIKNYDRNSENTNLLVSNNEIKVIDHNMAFSKDYTIEKLRYHIFYDEIDGEKLRDFVFRDQLSYKIENILKEYDEIVGSIPKEWQYLDPPAYTTPSTVNYQWIKETLHRYDELEFWSFI